MAKKSIEINFLKTMLNYDFNSINDELAETIYTLLQDPEVDL